LPKNLLEKEILFQSDLERLIGKRPFAHQTTYEKFTNGTNTEVKEESKSNGVQETTPETASEVK
jgi:AFG3 family protein